MTVGIGKRRDGMAAGPRNMSSACNLNFTPSHVTSLNYQLARTTSQRISSSVGGRMAIRDYPAVGSRFTIDDPVS